MATTPTFSTALEDITNGANDGYYFGQIGGLTGYNNWGGHQNRIIIDKSGYVWALYLLLTAGVTYWRLMKRTKPASDNTSSAWVEQAKYPTTDDVDLLHDTRDGAVYVVAFPPNGSSQGIWSIYSSRDNFASAWAIPGNWELLTASSRHYSGVGISPDGTIAVKANRENVVIFQQTDSTTYEYTTVKYNLTTNAWENTPWCQRYVGNRYGYDYMFPNPQVGGLTDGIYGLGASDLINAAAGYLLRPSNQYQFLGYKYWYTLATTPEVYWKYADRIRDRGAATATIDCYYRPLDAIINSKGHLMCLLFADGDGTVAYTKNYRAKGTWLLVFDEKRRLVQEQRISQILTFGDTRIIEDASGDLFLFWTNQGSVAAQCRLHKMVSSYRNINGQMLPFYTVQGTSSSGFTNLDSQLQNYAPVDRCPMVIRPRAGCAAPSQTYADLLLRFYNKINDGGTYNTSNAVAYAGGGQRTMYARLLLK